jgi:hypothetical protein
MQVKKCLFMLGYCYIFLLEREKDSDLISPKCGDTEGPGRQQYII